MASLKNLKEKIIGINKTSKVTKAMESISAIKMREAQKKALAGREYSFLVFSILKRVSKVVGRNIDEIFAASIPKKGRIGILLISPDKGLTGGMNNFLFKRVLNVIKEYELDRDNLSFICVGKRGYEFAKKNNFKIDKNFEGISEKKMDDELKDVANFIEESYRKEYYSRVIVVYTNFINTAEQKAVSRFILPVVYDEIKSFVKEIIPTKGKFSDVEEIDIDHSDVGAYIFEPSIEDVIKNLIPFILHVSVYNTLLESFASEHSSRMIAMKNSTDKARELSDNLRKKFNKERQAQITKEISEIVSGIEAMKD